MLPVGQKILTKQLQDLQNLLKLQLQCVQKQALN